MGKIKNRWLIALCGVGVHISIGSVYAYSVMVNPLKELHGWAKSDITLAFSIAILFLGLSAAFLGRFVEKYGPRVSGMVAGSMYGLGIFGVGVATRIGSLPLFVISYGAIAGIGLGVGYITPVSTLVKWFPDRRGLATGMAIMGFGFASMIFGPLMTKLFYTIGVSNTYFILSAVYFVVIFSSALYLEKPPEGWNPAGYVEKSKEPAKQDLAQLTSAEALKTKRFYYMWIMFFINITCGIALISVASPMAQEILGMSAMEAAAMVGLMGLFNGLGRLGWASFSDIIGRPLTYVSFFSLQIALFLILPGITNPILFQVVVFLIISCYGGGFSSVPAFLGDLFGTKELGAIHGTMLTAWAAAGLVGPTVVSRVKEFSGSYELTLRIFSLLFVVALVISLMLILNIKKKRVQLNRLAA